MTAAECVEEATRAGDRFQTVINSFVDGFLRADGSRRADLIRQPIERSGAMEGLVAAVVSALCRQTATSAPDWVGEIGSPVPFFAFPARSYELRVRLLVESPAPFRIRNVFVPENYLSRA